VGSEKTLYLETFGCQMNALDSELVLGELTTLGYRLTEDLAAASLVVINTCSVRQHAEDKVYSRLGQLKPSGRRNAERIVAVIGCMAERDGDGLMAKSPHVDILCGPNDLHRLPALVRHVEQGRGRPAAALSGRLRDRSTQTTDLETRQDLEALDAGRTFGLARHAATPKVFGRHQAYVRITRGCNKYCSFCVVPYTRGPEVHRPPDRIVEEVRRLTDGGVMEVTLLGQTVNHYNHRDEATGRQTTFAELLCRIHDETPRLPRLRFVTSFPRDFTDETLRAMAERPRICRYLHLPAQSGSDAVLKRMNRGYTVDQYKALLERAREILPDVCIAGDMIVGFSGETEADFAQSLELLRFARYKSCFIFKYSPRPGTRAEDRLPDDVPEAVKRRRNSEMLAVQAEINLANHRAMLGQTVDVLVEGYSKAARKAQPRDPDEEQESDEAIDRSNQLVGRTPGDQIVVMDGPPDLIGRIVPVRIAAATPHTMRGEVPADRRS